ncbi:MAG: 50S ribosomal protein L30 [Bacteroidetes bacterium]|nr:50S ribosomal protein L30 [Bacteroidota bacterium]
MKKLKIKQVKSGIGQAKRQKLTIQALGLKRMHHSIEVVGTPQILGMIAKVNHLLQVEEV